MKSNALKAIIILGWLSLFPSHTQTNAFAEIKEIIAEGSYDMCNAETPIVAEERALLIAKRNALEQAGTYIESYSRIKNFQLIHDEVQVLASGLIKVSILEKKRTLIKDGLSFWVKINAIVSRDSIEEMAKKIRMKSAIDDYKEDFVRIKTEYDKSQKEIEDLKRQLKEAQSAKEKGIVEKKISNEEKTFQAKLKLEEGWRHYINKNFDFAIRVYTSALVLDPNLSLAYNNRGASYLGKHLYDKALEDFNSANSINSAEAMPYCNRGFAYLKKGQLEKAMENFNRAIAINPNLALAYNNRGYCLGLLGYHDRAIEDCNKAIALNQNLAHAYNNRGWAYYEKNRILFTYRALEDYERAINLDPNLAAAYSNRGLIYLNKGLYDKAIAEFNKSITLDPNEAVVYSNRGSAYGEMGKYDKALEDLNKAISIDPNFSIAYKNRDYVYERMGKRQRPCLFF